MIEVGITEPAPRSLQNRERDVLRFDRDWVKVADYVSRLRARLPRQHQRSQQAETKNSTVDQAATSLGPRVPTSLHLVS